ncbi:MAG TPA: PHP domain-containing protein [Firmicutes bacterium]|jgi:predicted metal-dependent phosphoesterase TrpH|nr:PHP domain-containing protein [Bacillota bacterium]
MAKQPAPIYECDLHCHTVRSDGNDTPKELIDNAAAVGMKAIAITDHDIDPPRTVVDDEGRELDIVEYARGKGLELVLGDEFSCDTYVDDVHIIGFNLDWDHPLVKEEVERAKNSKSNAYKELCEILGQKGMPVDWEKEILEYRDSEGNIKHRDPDEVQRKHIFEAMASKGYAPTWQEAKLLVRDNPELNVKRKKIDPLEAIKLIKTCDGIAVLAHPYLIDEEINYPDGRRLTREEYIEKLIAAGLDGMEAAYPYSKTSYKGTMTDEEIKREVKAKYAGKVKFFSGGSDYHNDGKKGVKNPRFIGEGGISYQEFKAIFG